MLLCGQPLNRAPATIAGADVLVIPSINYIYGSVFRSSRPVRTWKLQASCECIVILQRPTYHRTGSPCVAMVVYPGSCNLIGKYFHLPYPLHYRMRLGTKSVNASSPSMWQVDAFIPRRTMQYPGTKMTVGRSINDY